VQKPVANAEAQAGDKGAKDIKIVPSKDAAEVRKKPEPAIPEKGNPAVAIPKVCPIKVPDTDKRELSARDPFSDHSRKALRYKDDLRDALRRRNANLDGINSRIDSLNRMDRQLQDHDAARIHLTRDEREH
jgi:hypothetical protein